jgi:hypothetical protein
MKNPVLLWLPTIAGVVAGTATAVVVTLAYVQPQFQAIRDQIDTLAVTTSTPEIIPPVQIVPIEPRPLVPAYPPAFLERRISSVVTVVRRGRADGMPVAAERELGAAVAITSDGWLATSWSAVNGLRLNELGVAWSGRVYPVLRAVRDTATDIVYLNINAHGLPAAAFARASDVESGAAVWYEPRPGQLRADLVIDDSSMLTREALSSERAGRRFLVDGTCRSKCRSCCVGWRRKISWYRRRECAEWRSRYSGRGSWAQLLHSSSARMRSRARSWESVASTWRISLLIRRARRFHSSARGCARYLQGRQRIEIWQRMM